ncbi:MAG: hypothetical protein HRJ53_07395, partial [Acidobacteria bacterium Pan2503]|nr:hypothetical protein [Candidatus Acidoferrum panamensis]
ILKEKWHHRLPMQIFHYVSNKHKDPGECSTLEITHGVTEARMASFW